MIELNFPEKYHFKFKKRGDQTLIFDIVRKEYYLLTPEEWVRQHLIHFFIHTKGYPRACLSVESIVKVNGMNKRADLIVYLKAQPFLLAECKSPEVKLSQETFNQAFRYNQTVTAKIILITNGLSTKSCSSSGEIITEIPSY